MITNVRLQNFRSYIDSSFEFDDGVNIVVGPNATGKTNLIEAIYILARNTSFRVKDKDLIGFGSEWLRVDSYISNTNRVLKITNTNEGISKETIIDGKSYKRLPREQYFPIVLFEPNQLQLMSGGPEGRRNFIDELVSQSRSEHTASLQKYRRVVSQRNSLLKSGINDERQFFVWNTRLVELAAKLVSNRMGALNEINKTISDIYSDIAGKKHRVVLEYTSPCRLDNYASSLMKSLELSLDKDRLRGFTAFGPHREDVRISIDGKDTTVSASRGEARTMLLALKTFEIQEFVKTNKHRPILLLDDVFSELDGLRRKKLTSFLDKYQSFITTTDADIVRSNIKSSKIITTSNLN